MGINSNETPKWTRQVAEEIAIKVLRAVGLMCGVDKSEQDRKEFSQFMATASTNAIEREFALTISMLIDRIEPIITRYMEAEDGGRH